MIDTSRQEILDTVNQYNTIFSSYSGNYGKNSVEENDGDQDMVGEREGEGQGEVERERDGKWRGEVDGCDTIYGKKERSTKKKNESKTLPPLAPLLFFLFHSFFF